MYKHVLIALLATLLVGAPVAPVSALGSQGGDARAQAQERREVNQQRVQERRERIQQQVEERKSEIKQQVCERREAVLERVIPRLSQGAISVKASIDKVYERVQGFYEDGQLTVENYDELNSDVEEAQAEAAVALEALGSYEFELDCANPNVGEQLDSFRTAVHDTRDELKEYRDSLVTLISSMRAEAAEQNAENEIEEETTEETENEAAETEEEEVNEV